VIFFSDRLAPVGSDSGSEPSGAIADVSLKALCSFPYTKATLWCEEFCAPLPFFLS